MKKLELSVQYLKGVGPYRAKRLEKLGIYTIEDLLFHFPRDYEDRKNIKKISELEDGLSQTILARVVEGPSDLKTRRGLIITTVKVKDDSGIAELIWFNQPYIKNSIKKGVNYIINGKVEKRLGIITIQNPVFEEDSKNNLNVGRIVPIYPSTSDLSQKVLRAIIKNALEEVEFTEIFKEPLRREFGLVGIADAIRNIHFPYDFDVLEKAKKRLKFQELFLLQLGLVLIKRNITEGKKGIAFQKNDGVEEFIKNLPFKLTKAQRKVFEEVRRDMERDKPMNRLIQGDVGSGKTIIAVLASLKAVINGYQSVLMAPTEILAEQHFISISQLFLPLGIRLCLLKGGLSKKEKDEILNGIKKGIYDIVIGTHALLQDNVEFKNLGLIITDEQHRFGVRQRALLSQKGSNPDVLVMTATPIPRTLALILYGDLDVSVIDELPPGRKEIKTYAVDGNMRDKVYRFVVQQIKEGRQAYIVCPLIEESESIRARSAINLYKELKEKYFSEFEVALLHGDIKDKEKEEIMEKFRRNKIQILVSTTVIEVGINIPNANIMVIENAERYGLSQLHQLRGRVGRGEYQSYCILIYDKITEIAKERMKVMVKSNNGFEIAEKDLLLRGPGDFFGTRQHGIPDFKIADLIHDIHLLQEIQKFIPSFLRNMSYYIDIDNTLKALNKLFKNDFNEIIMN